MDKLLEDLLRMTTTFAERIETVEEEDIYRFLKERERLVELIRTEAAKIPDVSLYEETVKEILRHDPLIAARIGKLKDQALHALTKVKIGRKQRQSYLHAYAAGSYFVDKKK